MAVLADRAVRRGIGANLDDNLYFSVLLLAKKMLIVFIKMNYKLRPEKFSEELMKVTYSQLTKSFLKSRFFWKGI